MAMHASKNRLRREHKITIGDCSYFLMLLLFYSTAAKSTKDKMPEISENKQKQINGVGNPLMSTKEGSLEGKKKNFCFMYA